ncbi:vacuolar protein sorting-associated protein 51 homolog [Hydractinia symbiolongicarpus]|uniref:vacuolar protein sorting-associated protein 51 homolog n=1 Tax=Hydractinia symbiolongicarpus TaxID=13093 RepID=UPI00254A7A17|nr:vacuolar protein sorting-associated protein 51 homolog [Hydractinia symbiolongicarpus]
MASNNIDDEELARRRKRGLLKMYYGANEQQQQQNPYDINQAHFQHDKYLDKLFKEKSLHELMDKESEIIKQIRSLDSDMQTLVYENYNKFIDATDTIKKMKNDFRKMEDEMTKLDTTLSSVTEFSDKVNSALHEKRSHIAQLSGVHTLLHKLQFLFELPNRLKKCIELKQFALAVRYYIKARDVLNKYKHMPSFQGIHSDCEAIVVDLMQNLREQLRNPTSSTRQLTECVDLLLKLGEPAGALCEEFLSLARDKVDESLENLRSQVELNIEGEELGVNEKMDDRKPTDILEFMDCGCNGFLGDISLVIASYNELFMTREINSSTEMSKIKEVANEKLTSFITNNMAEYFKFVRKRLEHETQTEDNTILVRALDKFYRKVQSVHQLMPESGMDRTAANIVAFSANNRVAQYSTFLKDQLSGIITDTRQALLTSRSPEADNSSIADILRQTSECIQEQVKSVLLNLKAFINPDVAFSMKPYFRGPFCIDDIREGLIVMFLKHLVERCNDFSQDSNKDNSVPAPLLLIMCRLCFDFANNIVSHLLKVTEGWFPVEDEIRQGCLVTKSEELQIDFKEASQELLNRYVGSQGLAISQMMRKSVETRDWLNTIEPRTVRAVMKRVVEDITFMDSQVGLLFEEGIRKANSSDSSRLTHNYSVSRAAPQRGQFNYGNNLNVDTSLMSNIQKLFTERIEVFTSVDFSKVSVLTGIVKIALKTLLECIRLRTFSRFGLQQIQVDTHYLSLFLWRFVNDENVVHFLLDESVNSAIHRCIEPELMEPSVVDMICDKN